MKFEDDTKADVKTLELSDVNRSNYKSYRSNFFQWAGLEKYIDLFKAKKYFFQPSLALKLLKLSG